MKIDTTLYKDEDIEARLNSLPESLREVLFHGNITQKIADVLAEEKLSPELIEKIRGTVTLIFLGMEYRSNLQKAIGEFVATDDENLTFRVADKIDTQIFKPVNFILSKTYEDDKEPTLKTLSKEEKHEDLPHRDSILSSIENPAPTKSTLQVVPAKTAPLVLNTDFSKPIEIKKTIAPGFMPQKSAPSPIPAPPKIQTLQTDLKSPAVIEEKKNLILPKTPEQKEEKITIVPSSKPQPDPYRESF